MTTRNLSSWLPGLTGPFDIQSDGGTILPRRSTIDFVGFLIEDDDENETTRITKPAGLSVTVGSSGASYRTDGVADEVQINQAITAVNAAGGGTVQLLAGTFTIAAPIVQQSNVTLLGAGPGCTKVAAVAGYSNTYKWMVNASGSATTNTAMTLASNATFADQLLTITASAETAAIAAGDHVFVKASRDADPIVTSHRYVGEFVKVLSVVSNSVNIYNSLRDSYATADTALAYRVSFVENCVIEGIEFYQADALGTRTNNAAIISLILTKNASVRRCLLRHNDGPGVYIGQSLGTYVSDCSIRDLHNVSPAFGYGVLIGGASEGVAVFDCNFENVRHAVDGGPHTGEPNFCNTYGIPRGIVVANNRATRTGAAAYTTHSDAQGWTFTGNSASNCIGHGFYIRGRGMSIHNNTVLHCTSGILVGDTAYYGSGGSAAGTSVIGNTVRYCKKLTSTAVYSAASVGQSAASGDGIVIGVTDNVTVQGNLIEYVDGAGIFLRIGACRNIIKNNVILNANLLNVAATASRSSAITIENGYRVLDATIAMSGSTATVTTAGTIDDIIVGRSVLIHDAINAGNNGTFTIIDKPSATTFRFTNASGVNEVGTIQYAIEACTDNLFEGNTARNTTSIFDPNSTGHSKYLIKDEGVTASVLASSVHQCNVRNIFKNNTGLGMETGLMNVTDASFTAGNAAGEGQPVKSKASIPVDADFLSGTPAAGTLAQNSTTGRLYVRNSTAWEPVGAYSIALTNTFTTTLDTNTNTNLAFPVKNGETWRFQFYLSAQNDNTGGIKYQISGPTGTLLAWAEATSTTGTSVFRTRINAVNTLTAATQTFNGSPARVMITGVFTATADGTVSLGAASNTAGQSTTIAALSSLQVSKVTLV